MAYKALSMDDMDTWSKLAHEASDDIVSQLITDPTIFYESFETYEDEDK